MIALYKVESLIFLYGAQRKNMDVSDIAERRKYNERNEEDLSVLVSDYAVRILKMD
ncbi:MAG: hypothetical protein ACLTFJ_13265 [Clostridium sp.]